MNKLQKIKELLSVGRLLSKDSFNVDNLDKILDGREIEIFENEWLRVYYFLKTKEDSIVQEVKELINSIREESFKITYNATKSSDLAGYVSDDFGLIVEALFFDYQDEWINALANEYVNNRIPCNELTPLRGNLEEIIIKS